jgi:hypothetical protein
MVSPGGFAVQVIFATLGTLLFATMALFFLWRESSFLSIPDFLD